MVFPSSVDELILILEYDCGKVYLYSLFNVITISLLVNEYVAESIKDEAFLPSNFKFEVTISLILLVNCEDVYLFLLISFWNESNNPLISSNVKLTPWSNDIPSFLDAALTKIPAAVATPPVTNNEDNVPITMVFFTHFLLSFLSKFHLMFIYLPFTFLLCNNK